MERRMRAERRGQIHPAAGEARQPAVGVDRGRSTSPKAASISAPSTIAKEASSRSTPRSIVRLRVTPRPRGFGGAAWIAGRSCEPKSGSASPMGKPSEGGRSPIRSMSPNPPRDGRAGGGSLERSMSANEEEIGACDSRCGSGGGGAAARGAAGRGAAGRGGAPRISSARAGAGAGRSASAPPLPGFITTRFVPHLGQRIFRPAGGMRFSSIW